MGAAFLYGGAGSGKPRLKVYAPAGSSLTAVCGDKTVTGAVGEGGYGVLKLDYGTWTVTAGLEGESATASVVIQEQSVTMEYKLWLYKDGVTSYTWNAVAKPMSSNSGSYTPVITPTAGGVQVSLTSSQGVYKGGIYYISDAIDLTDYSTLTLEYDKTNAGKVMLTAWTSIGSHASQNYSGRVQLTGGNNQVAALDVSAISGGHLIGLAMEHSANGTITTTIKRLYLE